MKENSSSKKVTYKSLDFTGFLGYRVGDDGSFWKKVKGIWKQRKATVKKDGYCVVGVWDGETQKVILLHRLVLEAFVGSCPEGREACHFDNNRSNNCLSNLRWDTRKNNQADRIRHGTSNQGEMNYSVKVTEDDVREIRRLYAIGDYTEKQLQQKFKLSKSQVNKIVNWKMWKHVK